MRYAIIVMCLNLSGFNLPIVDCYGSDNSLTLTKYQNSYTIIDRQKRFSKKKIKPKNLPPKIEPEPIKPGPITEDKSGNIAIRVNAKPGAKKTEITDVSADAIDIKLKAPAQEGKANSELINFLSDVLNIKKNDIELKRGHQSRDKTVVVGGSGNSPESLHKKVFDWIKNPKKKGRF
ncbi:UPF0235 protein C15orf40 homolog [Adelges cooleyi]|uniref:UPF0235 protein C15orf40 homolog n=1 Tax=Adelges cooleyi TaxID=133065 RepID=UPI00217F81BE|nr:UPF0235 protein C15orf40 homolog [Adelges cooleyi]